LEILLKYFPDLIAKQIENFSKLNNLYLEWNDKINVISRKDIDLLYQRHVLHSLSIAKIISFHKGSSIVDIGTGGGFPGIPLAIMFPEVNFLLIDSIGKKIKVVNSIIENLNLQNVKAQHLHSNELKGKFDFIISRAVTAFPQFVKYSEGKIKAESINSLSNGILYLKGGDLTDEIKGFEKKITLFKISNYFSEDFFETKFIVHYPITDN
jgi:16S rRNA (guanine527-N7)-methyltransferase